MELWRTVTTDPVDRSALTLEVHIGAHGPRARIAVGPGVGPHETTSPAAFRQWLRDMQGAADAFDAAVALWDAREQQGVLL